MTKDLEGLSNDELLQRRGEIGYAAQMAALEGLPLDEDTVDEGRALEAELARRGVSLATGEVTTAREQRR